LSFFAGSLGRQNSLIYSKFTKQEGASVPLTFGAIYEDPIKFIPPKKVITRSKKVEVEPMIKRQFKKHGCILEYALGICNPDRLSVIIPFREALAVDDETSYRLTI